MEGPTFKLRGQLELAPQSRGQRRESLSLSPFFFIVIFLFYFSFFCCVRLFGRSFHEFGRSFHERALANGLCNPLNIVFLVRGFWDPQREGVLEVTSPGWSLQELLGWSLQEPPQFN